MLPTVFHGIPATGFDQSETVLECHQLAPSQQAFGLRLTSFSPMYQCSTCRATEIISIFSAQKSKITLLANVCKKPPS